MINSDDNYCERYDEYYDSNDINLTAEARAAILCYKLDSPYEWLEAYCKTLYRIKPVNLSLTKGTCRMTTYRRLASALLLVYY